MAGTLNPLGRGKLSPLAVGLLAYWRLEEASGSRADALGVATLTDVLGNVGQAAGRIGNAAQFTAASKKKLNRAVDSFRLSGDLTVSVWIFPDLIAGGDSVAGRGVAAVHTGDLTGDWILGVGTVTSVGTSDITFFNWKNSGQDTTGKHRTSGRAVVLSQWQHLVARRVSGVYSIWHNGVSQALAADAGTLQGWSNTKLTLGTSWNDPSDSPAYYYEGRIDELAIYGRALADSEIAQLYNGGNGLAPV